MPADTGSLATSMAASPSPNTGPADEFADLPQDLLAALRRLPPAMAENQARLWQGLQNDPAAQDLQAQAILAIASNATLRGPNQHDGNPSTLVSSKAVELRTKDLLEKIGDVPKYNGQIRNDAAREFLRNCERYFRRYQELLGHEYPDFQKVIFAQGRFKDFAQKRWDGHEQAVEKNLARPVRTWTAFTEWIHTTFGEHLSSERRYKRFVELRQGRFSFMSYFQKVMEAVAALDYAVPEDLIIRQLVLGLSPTLAPKWAEERDKPSGLQATVVRLRELEDGARSRREYEESDLMDLSALTSPPIGRRTAQFRKGPRRCYNCSSTEHIARDCPRQARKPNRSNATKRESENSQAH
ncbi:hypothetical protein N7532_004837 [Penicillium argentinense]|uniref:CCHC-type domain-containing protein n=1 Tax=Penicillium argentinense TaxID=1131581 RepID=A0A9W9FCR2_9EURO|nr:uncharacterized protein N7532_004837 [Penicillium argentinense]KAJ5097836.1 hypothetical protein N7532_004837 [Penicillium argentinense]